MGEENKVSLCWGIPNDELKMKPINFAESGICSLSLDDSPSPIKDDKGGFSMSFDMTMDKKNGMKLRRMFGIKKERLPRKEKKRILKFVRNYFPILYKELIEVHGGRKLANYLAHRYKDIPQGRSTYDICRAIVSILFDYENKDKDL